MSDIFKDTELRSVGAVQLYLVMQTLCQFLQRQQTLKQTKTAKNSLLVYKNVPINAKLFHFSTV